MTTKQEILNAMREMGLSVSTDPAHGSDGVLSLYTMIDSHGNVAVSDKSVRISDGSLRSGRGPTDRIDIVNALVIAGDIYNQKLPFYEWCERCGHDKDSDDAMSEYERALETGEALTRSISVKDFDRLRRMCREYGNKCACNKEDRK